MASLQRNFIPAILLVASVAFAGAPLRAAERLAYNPVTRHMEAVYRPRRSLPGRSIGNLQQFEQRTTSRPQPAQRQAALGIDVESDDAGAVEPASYNTEELPPEARTVEPADPFESMDMDHGSVGYDVGCCDAVAGPVSCSDCEAVGRPRGGHWFGGVELTFVQPRFEDNLAFTVTESDDTSFESSSATDFSYDLELSPRVIVGWENCAGLGVRATWWRFDHAPDAESAQPPANGFGLIESPSFGDVDLSTSIPTDTYSAESDLNAYTLDLEATKCTSFCAWQFGVGCGVRYARVEQAYLAQLRDVDDAIRGQIDFRHSVAGFGPTLSLFAARPLAYRLSLVGRARGSALFGDGKSRLVAGEDLDLSTPFTTTETSDRDDVLSIAEIQCGLLWQGKRPHNQPWQPFATIALEGQIWNGAGNAASEDGNLGFFGFNVGAGCDW